MTDWEDAVNLMKVNSKVNLKGKSKKNKKLLDPVGLRCWECGQYLDNLKSGHYCGNCLVKHLKKLGMLQAKEKLAKNDKKIMSEL